MSQITFLDLMQQTMWMIIILCAPVLLVAMTVGIIISLLQSVTQLQEATLTFVPKILASLITIIFVSPWMLHLYIEHTQRVLRSISTLTYH